MPKPGIKYSEADAEAEISPIESKSYNHDISKATGGLFDRCLRIEGEESWLPIVLLGDRMAR